MNSRFIAALALLVLDLPWILWGWVPAPTIELWYLAAFANELRPLWIAIALVAAGLALASWRGGARGTRRRIAHGALVACALVGVVAALVLETRRWAVAEDLGVELSAGRFLTDWTRDAGRPTAVVDFARIEERTLRLDVWAPGGGTSAAPPRIAVVRVHGGSWAFGERSEAPHWCRFLAERDCVVFDVEYRLTPPPRWRDAVEDVRAAVEWVRAHASEWNVDRIVLMGASAGGHLALCAAYGDDADFPPSPVVGGSAGRERTGTIPVVGAIAISPPVVLDIGFDADYPWWYPIDLRSTERVEQLIGGTPDDFPERFALASPTTHVTATSPRTLLIHGANDRLVWPANVERLAERLAAFGVHYELVLLPATDHLFEYVPGGFGTQIAEERVARFLAGL
jgi:acetyl esterase/lipase